MPVTKGGKRENSHRHADPHWGAWKSTGYVGRQDISRISAHLSDIDVDFARHWSLSNRTRKEGILVKPAEKVKDATMRQPTIRHNEKQRRIHSVSQILRS